MTDRTQRSDLELCAQGRDNVEIMPQKVIVEVVSQAIRDTVAKEQKT